MSKAEQSTRMHDIITALSSPPPPPRQTRSKRFVELATGLIEYRPHKRPRSSALLLVGRNNHQEEAALDDSSPKQEGESKDLKPDDDKMDVSETVGSGTAEKDEKMKPDVAKETKISGTGNDSAEKSTKDEENPDDDDKSKTNRTAMEMARERITNLRAVYLYGLEQVHNLQDLRLAPDALLPGNTVPESAYTS